MQVIKHLLKPCLVLSLFLSMFVSEDIWAGSGLTGVFVSSKIRPYLEALEGFKNTSDRELLVLYLDENPELARHYLLKGELDAAVAIGPEAAKLIYSTKSPVAVRMVIMTLDIKKLLPNIDPCGIDLRLPISYQITRIAYRLGRNRSLAIIFNPEENSDITAAARLACKKNGLSFIPLPVTGTDEIMKKLRPEIKNIDILLFIPDSTVISEKIVTHLIKEAIFNGIAAVGYNHFFYETGALMAFTIDYKKTGADGARLLEEISKGRCRLLPPPVTEEWNSKVIKILRSKRPDRWKEIPGGAADDR